MVNIQCVKCALGFWGRFLVVCIYLIDLLFLEGASLHIERRVHCADLLKTVEFCPSLGFWHACDIKSSQLFIVFQPCQSQLPRSPSPWPKVSYFIIIYTRYTHMSVCTHTCCYLTSSSFYLFIYLFIYLSIYLLIYLSWERGRERARERQSERGRERILSRLLAVRAEPDIGPNLTNREIMTWAKTDWATQVPQTSILISVGFGKSLGATDIHKLIHETINKLVLKAS